MSQSGIFWGQATLNPINGPIRAAQSTPLNTQVDFLKTETSTKNLNSCLVLLQLFGWNGTLFHHSGITRHRKECQINNNLKICIVSVFLSLTLWTKPFISWSFSFSSLQNGNNGTCPISITDRVCKYVTPACFSAPMADITNRLFHFLIEPGCSFND